MRVWSRGALTVLAGVLALLLVPTMAPAQLSAADSLRAPLTGENFYFVMADRFENGDASNDLGGLPADRLTSGFDPTHTGFYHGGDLAGIRARLDYIRDLGTTALWLTPSFKNKAVQLPDGPSAGYHGYWVTDFTQIDPHLGTNAELASLIDEAHAMGMKVFFDIITNHTADVIRYTEGDRPVYLPKDVEPYRTAAGEPFDDRDYAGTQSFPALDPIVSFPYTPVVAPEEPRKVPEWLNDITLYHHRGNTTYVGEDSYYGDFAGLDDLFTEHPRVVQGMVDVYSAWIRDFGIDGFRIDTMKHVDDEFWQRFAPEVLANARAAGKPEFFMFGEVFDTTKPFTSRYTTHNDVQAVLDFPFQKAAQDFAASSRPTDALRDFFVGDDWYTDHNSNAYQLPTFLGNHDMGRIGRFVRVDNAGADDAEVLARDRLAHQLMYLSRGNPVIYYGDEQGFVGDGGDQGARQDMFPSRVASYNDDDLIGTDATTAEENFDTGHPLYEGIARLAQVRGYYTALRDGAQQHRLSSPGPGIYAFSRIGRDAQRELLVAVNNAEEARTATIPTYSPRMPFRRVYGSGTRLLESGADRGLAVTVPPLSAVVYRATARLRPSVSAPAIVLADPGLLRDRAEVRATVSGGGFNQVTFLARVGGGAWTSIGTDDNSPYRVFHDVSDVEPGTAIRYRALVKDNEGNVRRSAFQSGRVAPPAIALEAPGDSGRVRGRVEVRAVPTPDQPSYAVTLERQLGDGAWTAIGTDTSSPVYTAFDDTTGLADGTVVRYRAVLDYGGGRTVTSAVRSVQIVATPVTTAIVHYNRPARDYADWGLHLFGEGLTSGAATDWTAPRQRTGVDGYGAVYEIPVGDDTRRVCLIVHTPGGDVIPDTREPGGDRCFVPLNTPELWLRQGDPAVYTSAP